MTPEMQAKVGKRGDKLVMSIPIAAVVVYLAYATIRYLGVEGIVLQDTKRLDRYCEKTDALLLDNTRDHAEIKGDIKSILRLLRERDVANTGGR